MLKITRILAGSILFLVLLGCRTLTSNFATSTPAALPTAAAEPTGLAMQLPTLTGDWHITVTQSGGIMGMSRKLEISKGGEMAVTDMRTNKKNQANLTAEKQDELAKLVAATQYQPISAPSGCADCFIYDFDISSGGKKFQVQLNQIDLAKSGLQPLVDFLGEYLNGAGK
ncbi:MAG TPA: hypothetical protein VGK00_17230 [Anaerolineales bacterium]|jgi:hypothetical protein